MTVLELQKALKELCTEEFNGFSILSKPLQVFLQDLPYETSDEEDEDKFFPSIIIRLEGGNFEDSSSPQVASINIVIGAVDETADMQGYQDIVIIAERLVNKIKEMGNVGGVFRLKYPFEYEISEDNYPYFFGVIKTKWETACVDLSTEQYI